jgi:lipid-binding SYLF domain-containing protein
MSRLRCPLVAGLLLLAVAAPAARAGSRPVDTIDASAETVQALASLPLRGIPPALLRDATGVAIIPDVLKAGFVIGGRFGRGVVLPRMADGSWGNPVFITMAGGSFGWQAGIQSTDIVLVFKTRASLDRILAGKSKVTLGGDVAIAAGPVGRQAEAATDGQLRSEIYSYSRSRGLFAGVSLEGAGLLVDFSANGAFYNVPGGHPSQIVGVPGLPVPVPAASLRSLLSTLASPPAPVIFPEAPPAPARVVPAPASAPVPPAQPPR